MIDGAMDSEERPARARNLEAELAARLEAVQADAASETAVQADVASETADSASNARGVMLAPSDGQNRRQRRAAAKEARRRGKGWTR
jgi:hypothetical protein